MRAAPATTEELLPYDDQGAGRPLVFLHGLTFSRTSWQPVVERLATEFRCITVDLPGHGESQDGRRALPAVADAVHRRLDALGVGDAVLIGHSMGAAVAVHLAARRAVHGLVIVDQPLAVEAFAAAVGAALPDLDSDRFDEAFAPFEGSIGLHRLHEGERDRVRRGRRVDRELVVSYFAEVAAVPPAEFQRSLDGAAAKVTAPALAVFGRSVAPDAVASLGSDVAVEHWRSGGHLVHLAEPDRFAHRVARFAARCFDPVPSDHVALDANRSLLVGMVRRCLAGHDLDGLRGYTDDPRLLASFTSIVTGFPDLDCDIEWVTADDDRVSAWLAVTGTHRGTWRGWPPTGRRMSARASLTLRIEGGRAVDFWLAADWIGIHRQLGLSLSAEERVGAVEDRSAVT